MVETCEHEKLNCVVVYETGHGGCPVCNLVAALEEKVADLKDEIEQEIKS